MTYAKSDGTTISFYRQPLHIDGRDVYTTNPRQYDTDWKEYVHIEPPQQEGYYAVLDGYDVTETTISPRYRLEPIPEPEADISDYQDALNELGVDTDEEE